MIIFAKFVILLLTSIIFSNIHAQSIDSNKTSKLDSLVYHEIISDNVDSIRVNNLSRIVYSYRYNVSTVPAILEIKKIAEHSNNKVLLAESNRIFGNYYYYQSELDSAEYYLLKSKELLQGKKRPFLDIRVRTSLGGVYRKKGEMSKAIDIILESKAILDKAIDNRASSEDGKKLITQQIIVNNTLANFYNQMEDYSKAIECYDIAYEKSISVNSFVSAGVVLSNKGDLLLNINDNEKALIVLDKALALKVKGKASKISLANTEQNIALAYFKLLKFKESLKHINVALDSYKESNLKSGLMESYIIRGNIYLSINEINSAISDCIVSRDIAIENGVLENKEKSCLCLYKAYSLKGNYKESLSNYEDYISAKDSIFNEKNIKNITQLEMKYTFDKEKEFHSFISLNKEKESRMIIRSLILGLFALMVIAGLYYRLSYVNKESNLKLTEKNNQITDALVVNETLLKETHHRVKNNLQIISSLLNMQTRYLDDDKSKAIVTDSKNRIKSMSLIHQKLYQENNLTGIETKIYFTELINSLVLSYGIDRDKVSIDISVENLLLDVDTVIPLGLILNEVISNAFKYGVSKETGCFKFNFSKINNQELLISVQDNGPGIPESFNISESKSYGMKLIQLLSKKLKADINFENNNGLKVILTIHKFKLA